MGAIAMPNRLLRVSLTEKVRLGKDLREAKK